MNSMLKIIAVLVLISTLIEYSVGQKSLMDSKVINKFCGAKKPDSTVTSAVTACAGATSSELQTIYTTCLSGSSDILATVCSQESRTKLNTCFMAEAKKITDATTRKSMRNSLKALKTCLMKISTS